MKNDMGEISDVFDVDSTPSSPPIDDHIVTCDCCHKKLKRERAFTFGTDHYLCTACAKKSFQELENKLQQAHVLSKKRKYCFVCNNEVDEELPANWLGKVKIGDIELEPNAPLCLSCANAFAIFLIDYLEERGWHRSTIDKKYPYGRTTKPVKKDALATFLAAVVMKVRSNTELKETMDSLATYEKYLIKQAKKEKEGISNETISSGEQEG